MFWSYKLKVKCNEFKNKKISCNFFLSNFVINLNINSSSFIKIVESIDI